MDGVVTGEIVNANGGYCFAMAPLEGFAVNVDENNQVIISPATSGNVAYYVVGLSVYCDLVYSNGVKWGTDLIKINYTINADELATDGQTGIYKYQLRQLDTYLENVTTKNYAFSASDYTFTEEELNNGYAIVEVDGVNYYVITDNDGSDAVVSSVYRLINNQNLSVKVYAYDANDNLIGLVK